MGNEQSAPIVVDVAVANRVIMGSPSATPASSSSSSQTPSAQNMPPRMARQHERLVMELLPFGTVEQFHLWLESAPVLGSWLEFRANCRHVDLDEVDKTRAAQMTRDALNSKSARYLVYHPDKEGWTVEDHIVRFMATIMKDALLQGVWDEGELENKTLDIAKAVYEVLCFFKAVDEQPTEPGSDDAAGEQPPDYHPPDYQPPDYTA
ncbi:hypothetical protein MCOR27_001437 [Pyricularia oryzae]|uniref:Uncharacterized protein n=1 Tax=Pyricularia oryzae TaxID=318829 RepID=A0A4P7N1P1_PYROR|nr:hypothetical protein MCOR01_010382 [Pyricularia oryzae]KAI6284225.1 hypothetical protein MCOR26_002078 [Pyricularia oryzae]KAI6287260.1 hypothetical protein MCOR27_001437 [Pyricularia oryzae]KAI6345468.1 hypothetical protein MCOR28_003538 [Pyricularia oryzae]KAI6373988.1 hypothetical protein MCOR31_002946 [Pyricularia oryzae]